MPENIPVGYGLLVNRVQTPANELASFSVGVELSTGTTGQEAVDGAFAATKTRFGPQTDSNYTFIRSDLYIRPTANTLQLFQSTGAVAAGGAASSSAPSAVAYTARKRTAFVGRGFRGRMYLPIGVAEGNVDEGGRVLPATLTTIGGVVTNWWSDLTTGIDAVFSSMFVFRHPRLNPGIEPPVYGEPEPIEITSWAIAPIVGIQRRRLPKA